EQATSVRVLAENATDLIVPRRVWPTLPSRVASVCERRFGLLSNAAPSCSSRLMARASNRYTRGLLLHEVDVLDNLAVTTVTAARPAAALRTPTRPRSAPAGPG